MATIKIVKMVNRTRQDGHKMVNWTEAIRIVRMVSRTIQDFHRIINRTKTQDKVGRKWKKANRPKLKICPPYLDKRQRAQKRERKVFWMAAKAGHQHLQRWLHEAVFKEERRSPPHQLLPGCLQCPPERPHFPLEWRLFLSEPLPSPRLPLLSPRSRLPSLRGGTSPPPPYSLSLSPFHCCSNSFSNFYFYTQLC